MIDGNIVNGAGVTSGIDFALTLAAVLESKQVAREIQLGIEYDPAPPSIPARRSRPRAKR